MSPTGWRYRVLVNKHSSGNPLPGEIYRLDVAHLKVWGSPGEWRYSNGPTKPDVDWMVDAEPLYASLPPLDNPVATPPTPIHTPVTSD